MWRTIAAIFLCTLAGIGLGYGFGLLLDSVSPLFGDRLLGTDDPSTPGFERTPGLNLALGLANGAWMGFLVGVLAALIEGFLRAKQISARGGEPPA